MSNSSFGVVESIFASLTVAVVMASFPSPAVAAPFIEVDRRFIIILGRAYCLYNCNETRTAPSIPLMPAIIPPKPR